jgi:EAL domain-containing protein (putative c-di-GMP-specific phosphodiesterase class I)
VSSIPAIRELQEPLGEIFRRQGGLGAVVVDLLPLARIERAFGVAVYQTVREQLEPLLLEMRQQVREADLLARDEREGDRYILFLSERRKPDVPFALRDLGAIADRVEDFLSPRVARLVLPYLRDRPRLDVGYGFALQSPFETEERQIQRVIHDATATADLRRRLKTREQREKLLEVIFNRQVWTVFQPIQEIASRRILGHEALSRGPRGTELESPLPLFGLAARHGLTEELERCCRHRAFRDWEVFGAPSRLFVNTVPATVRDSSFLGRGVLDYLGPNLSPRSVTLEITERQVIENLTLYRDAMHSFIELGFSFAIDDVGAGYSGLETIATLGASYLKIDMALVRDIHTKRSSQQIVKAILEMGQGVGATVIAEGIQTQEEADAVLEIGIRYGQGYLWGRPLDPHAPRSRVVVKEP